MKPNIFYLYLFIFLIYFSSIVDARIPKREPLRNTPYYQELKTMHFRVRNLVYKQEDLTLINTIVAEFFETTKLPPIDELKFRLNTLHYLVKHIQLPKYELKALQKYAVALSSYDLAPIRYVLIQIIWWTEARLIEDDEQLKNHLNKQIYSRFQEDIFNIYAERGMEKQIIYWSTALKRNQKPEELKIALRKAKFINLLKSNPDDLTAKVNEELKYSFYQSLQPFKSGSSEELDYFKWLFHQMGLYRTNNNITKILNAIIEDESYIYIKKVKLLPVEIQEDFTKNLKERYNIEYKAKQALMPFTDVYRDLYRY